MTWVFCRNRQAPTLCYTPASPPVLAFLFSPSSSPSTLHRPDHRQCPTAGTTSRTRHLPPPRALLPHRRLRPLSSGIYYVANGPRTSATTSAYASKYCSARKKTCAGRLQTSTKQDRHRSAVLGKSFLNAPRRSSATCPSSTHRLQLCTVERKKDSSGSQRAHLLPHLHLAPFISPNASPDTRPRVTATASVHLPLPPIHHVGMVLGLTPVIGIPLPFFPTAESSRVGFTILHLNFLRRTPSATSTEVAPTPSLRTYLPTPLHPPPTRRKLPSHTKAFPTPQGLLSASRRPSATISSSRNSNHTTAAT
jgi:hypothetical protein